MNKIFYLSLGLVCLAGFSSCSDDQDNPYDVAKTISVVSSKVSFDARAAQGAIHFNSAATPVVTTNQPWCTASLAADSVVVSVTQNNSISGRAAMVTLHNGTDSVNVPVVQEGAFVEVNGSTSLGLSSDNATSGKYLISSNLDVSIASAPDWITASIKGDSLLMNVAANETGNLRSGDIVFKSGDFTYAWRVNQADFNKDIAGKYYLYYKTKSGSTSRVSVNLTNKAIEIGSGKNMRSITTTYEPRTATFSIKSGQYVNYMNITTTKTDFSVKKDTTYLHLLFASQPQADGNYYWSVYGQGVEAKAQLEVAEDGSSKAQFGGSLMGYALTQFIFRYFSSLSLNEKTDTGENWMIMYSPYLYREKPNKAKSYILR